MTLIIGFLVLGLLITVHEFGHFIIAKLCGVGVIEFAIGFGQRIVSKRIGETRYSLRVFPLGGFVRMVGDTAGGFIEGIEEDKKPAETEAAPEVFDEIQQKMLNDKSRWFLEKPLWARAAIVAAGPFFNLLFAFIFAVAGAWIWGAAEPVNEPLIGDVSSGMPAQKAGVLPGDRILSIDGKSLTTWKDLADTISTSAGRELSLQIERMVEGTRSSVEIKITAEPESAELRLLDDSERKEISYKIGVAPEAIYEPVSALKSFSMGAQHVYFLSALTLKSMWFMIRGEVSPRHIAGPISIFQEAAKSAGKGAPHLLSFIILLSVSLAVLNILPVPVLDGGHLLFMLIEFCLRRPLSVRVQGLANQVGMAALLMLMLFAIGNDIFRLVE